MLEMALEKEVQKLLVEAMDIDDEIYRNDIGDQCSVFYALT